MRTLAFTLLACAGLALSTAAGAQDEPPASAEDYVCEFTGECPEEAEPEADANGDRPRVSASRGFALSGSSSSSGRASTPPRQNAAPRRPRRPQAAARRPGPGQRVNLRLTFDTGSANLTAGARAQAQVFAQSLLRPQLRNMRFQIEGHTDAVGARQRNVELSRRRAEAVADFLVSLGVGRDRLLVRGYGPDRPLPGTRATSGENRRVEAVRIS